MYGFCRAEQCTQLKRLLALSRLPFDARRPDHAQLLENYWRACCRGRQPWQGSSGEQWLALGFQGRDPATDFRGGRGQTISGAAAMAVLSSIDTGTPAPYSRPLALRPSVYSSQRYLFCAGIRHAT